MRLDIPTLSLVLAMVHVMNAVLSLVLSVSRQTFRGAKRWIAGQICLGVSFLGLLLRPWLPPLVGIVWPNALFLLGTTLYGHSLWAFRFRRNFPKLAYLLPAVGTIAFALFYTSDFNFRAALFSAFTAIATGAIALILFYRVEPYFRVANYLTALPFALIALANATRLIVNLTGPKVPSFDSQAGFNALYLLLSIGVSSLTLFGYFMMNGIRSERALLLKDEEIERRNGDLAELARTRAMFLSIIAHDLRSPIGGSARYVRKHLLKSGTDLNTKLGAITTLAGTLDRTYELLEQLLWWSRAQEEAWAPTKVRVEVGAVFASAQALAKDMAEAKGILVRFSILPGAEALLADRECVELVVRNLLSNAIKFSDAGGEIRLRAEPSKGAVRIVVEDEGIGIDEATLSNLFKIETKRFRRGTEGELGSGFGLILCKSLVERNSGVLEIASVPGDGTTVSFSLPAPTR